METNKAAIVLTQFNETIETWITYLNGYTFEMLCTKPQPEGWSLGQVYVHIIEETAYFIEQMKAASLDHDNMQKEMHKRARGMFENNGFPDMLIEGAPENSNLRQPSSKQELLQGLESIKAAVNELYARVDFSACTGKTKHPGLQYFTALEWLQFSEMHMRHHFRQKRRIDEKLFG